MLTVVLAFALAACSGGGSESEDERVRAKQITGPIVGMLVAESVDAKGNPVEPTFTFPTSARRMTVLVQVGKVTGSPLTVAWYRGEKKLFEHTVEVGSYERAYSVGKTPGRLAPGTYRATATLEGKTAELEWDVAGESGAAATTAASATAGSEPTAGESAVTASPTQPTLFDTANDPGWRDYFGEDDDVRNYFHGDRDCMVVLFATSSGSNLDYEADTVGLRTGAEGCKGATVDVTAGAGTLVSYTAAAPGAVTAIHLAVDPCSLPGGSDLPGATARFRAATDGYAPPVVANLTVTLGDDTLAPRVRVTSTPAGGTKVEAGDQINVKVIAEERRRGGPWQTGVQLIQVTGPDGLVGEPTDYGRLPKKCAQKQWEGGHEVTYTVPSDPPPVIELCAIAEDFAGNEQSSCGTFFTGEVWQGTATEQYRLGVTGSAEAEIRLTVAADGSVTGQGAGEGVIDGVPFTFTLRIRGVRDEDRFRLRIKSSVSRTPAFPLVAPIDGTRARGTYDAVGAVVTVALACRTC